MRKKYSKPDIMYEDFTPSTSIAAGCEEKANLVEYECGVKYDDEMLFTSELGVCTLPIEVMPEPFDRICYHVPEPGNNVFTS